MLALKDLMTPAPVTITPSATLRDAVELLSKVGVNALPVVDGNTVVGVLTTLSIIAFESVTPEHLVLAGVGRCSIASLTYHARRGGLDLTAAATVSGAVTRREEDGRYAFVEIACEVDVELDPPLATAELAELLAKAERDCFIGASLRVAPRYQWRVNGEEI